MAEATLIGGMSIVLEAIDPTTGAAVSGVVLTNVAIYCETASGDLVSLPLDDTEPLFIPIALDDQAAA